MQENLAAKLCLLLGDLATQAEQWKLLGQEKDGALLLGWVENVSSQDGDRSYSVVGRYDRLADDLQVLHRFAAVLNLIQATVNQCNSLLGFVLKQKLDIDSQEIVAQVDASQDGSKPELEYYQAYIVEFKTEQPKVHALEKDKLKQIRMQFLYKERASKSLDKLLVLVHQEYVRMHTISLEPSPGAAGVQELRAETLVKSFIWAQWDGMNQVLYHIHHKKAATSLFSEPAAAEQPHEPACTTPTLSGLQFHDELPHETVLNIPLNLPQTPSSENCGTYEDDVIPLRIHDCSLDLIVISDQRGVVCVCHHYLYRPVQPAQHVLDAGPGDAGTVHFAYSVTLLHHSCVIQCVVPGVPWARAKLMKPTFALHGDSHMLVFVQDALTHLLEVGLHHQPCCHVLSGPLGGLAGRASYLVPLLGLPGAPAGPADILTVDLPTLDLVRLALPTSFLLEVFRREASLEVRLGALHYLLCHRPEPEALAELAAALAERARSRELARVLQEFLVGGAHALVQRGLPADALALLALVPVSTLAEAAGFEARAGELAVSLSHEKLWNTSVMLLSPQQRLVPYRSDLWTRLWDLLSKRSDELPRFRPGRVADKLAVSLACYQPEALSRCSTPMSPSAGGFAVTAAALGEPMAGRHGPGLPGLPFLESESCTASKQEHIVSVNLRELSVHLLKYGLGRGPRAPSCTPLQVHALSTRYVAAQLETSRLLCQMLCKAANVDARLEPERGFGLVDQLDDSRRWLLFTLLERYRHATESLGFPVPQGFMSFFTYLGYRAVKYPMFLQYVRHSVFELQVDVAKLIMADIGDTRESIGRKLELLAQLPRTRAKRLLNQWLHPMSFMLRAREHAANVLSGEISQSRNRLPQHRLRHSGLAVFPSTDRLSPLDTFLDLLTAKASLTELDFGLLIEATVTSTEDFL